MKKSILSVFAIAIVAVFAFTSCKQQTMTDYLTTEKGWTLSAAECTNGYVFDDNTTINNLFDGYVYDCEKDDIIKFNTDNYEYLNPGSDVCEWQPSQESSLGKWAINEEEKVLDMQIPFFYDEEVESCKIINLVKDELKVSFNFDIVEGEAKGKPGNYTFVLTYVPAK
ncbi:MAG: hypothetical protein J6X65_09375 [Bacteroidales bacterium]|nr:hypothetical protein [Bacteroidales bacterium]